MNLLNQISKHLIYPIIIRVYALLICFFSFFNTKAKFWVKGRKNWQNLMVQKLKILNNWDKKSLRIWVHSASLGEFEQARPLLAALKKELPNCQIICTFFSPSGYEIRKNYPQADWVTYLPLDTKSNAKFWVENLQADLVLWVKYDIWVNYLFELKKQAIPCILFSAIFRKKQHYFSFYGKYFTAALQSFSHIFVQNKTSVALLQKYGISEVSFAPDTRFDRVWQNAQNVEDTPAIFQFCKHKKIIIAGSTWQQDEAILVSFVNKKANSQHWKYIIAPHEIDLAKIADLQAKIKVKSILFSEIKQQDISNFEVLIIDCIGLLSSIYSYGNLAYIGGGFGSGIHNVLEPAVFNLPVIFGPKYQKFQEAKDLLALNGAKSIANLLDLEQAISFFEKNTVANQNYVKNNTGGTALVLQKALELLGK